MSLPPKFGLSPMRAQQSGRTTIRLGIVPHLCRSRYYDTRRPRLISMNPVGAQFEATIMPLRCGERQYQIVLIFREFFGGEPHPAEMLGTGRGAGQPAASHRGKTFDTATAASSREGGSFRYGPAAFASGHSRSNRVWGKPCEMWKETKTRTETLSLVGGDRQSSRIPPRTDQRPGRPPSRLIASRRLLLVESPGQSKVFREAMTARLRRSGPPVDIERMPPGASGGAPGRVQIARPQM